MGTKTTSTKLKILFVQSNYPPFLESFYNSIPNWKKLSYKEIKGLWAKELFGSSNFYSKNIKEYGWLADEIVLDDWNMQSIWAKEHHVSVSRSEVPLSKYIPPRIKNLLGLTGWMKEIFFAQIKDIKPDVIYMHDLTVFNDAELKRVKKCAKLLVGQIAYPLPLNQNVLKGYDLIISSFPHFVKMFREMGIQSQYLRWCIEANIPKLIGDRKRIYDVSYVGGFTPHHSNGNKILEAVARKVNIDFWGYGANFLIPNSPIKNNLHGEAWGKKIYEIFASSKITINRHINISENYANNMRMFDSTAMGALLITDDKSNMSEFFEVGKEVVVYKNSDDLIEKINYYLTHTDEREQIAKAGQRRTLKDHTYKVRMKELDTILRKYI